MLRLDINSLNNFDKNLDDLRIASEKFGETVKKIQTVSELPWYATKVCFSCHYDLEKNLPEWFKRTGCPKCNRTFLD